MKAFPLLQAKDIEVKVKQVTKSGAIALLYKTARVDMAMLDSVVGAENWENDYKEIDGVLFCGIGITDSGRTVWKWSNGVESRSDGDGNEKKGEASDAFKRAGFMWGIGRELYTAPFIFLNVCVEEDGKDNKGKPKYKLADKYETFAVKSIEYDSDKNISKVVICNDKGVVAFPKGSAPEEKKSEHKSAKAAPSISRRQQVARWLKNNGGIYTSDDVKTFMDARNKQVFDDLSEDDFNKLIALCENGAL